MNLATSIEASQPRAAHSEAVRADHVTLETDSRFFILVKMPGIHRADIAVDMYEDKHELVVMASRHGKLRDRMKYWVFAVPAQAAFHESTMRLENGVLEIVIPKQLQRAA